MAWIQGRLGFACIPAEPPNVPEGHWNLAGGVSHRMQIEENTRPGRGGTEEELAGISVLQPDDPHMFPISEMIFTSGINRANTMSGTHNAMISRPMPAIHAAIFPLAQMKNIVMAANTNKPIKITPP